MDPKVDIDSSWTRPGVTFRLSKSRRNDLLSLMAELPEPLAPTAAIDHAIAIAIASRASNAISEADTLADGLRILSAQAKRDASEQRRAIDEIRQYVKDLRDVISAAAASDDPDDFDSSESPMPIRDWLDREARNLPKRSFLAKAQWQAKVRLNDRSASIDLLIERVAAIDVHGPATHGAIAMARLAPVDLKDPFCKADEMPAFYLMCTGVGPEGWQLDLHPIQTDDHPAPRIATLRF